MSRKSRQNLWIVLCTCLVLGFALWLVLGRKSSSIQKRDMDFAVADTAAIHWIFLADNQESKVLLTRQEDNSWLLNKSETVVRSNVDNLLSVLHNITVKAPIANAAKENVKKWLAAGATKVQVAYDDYRFKIGGLHFWKYEKIKTFYMGSPTQDNMGNYAVMEGSDMPVVVYQPGFRGFISPYFSALESDWKSHQIVALRISQIKEVYVQDLENPLNSLRIVRNGERNFDIFSLMGDETGNSVKLPVYDTLKLYDHLGSYRSLNFEFFVDDLEKPARDSILELEFKRILIEDMDGNKTLISLYYMLNEYNTEEFEYNPDFMEAYNRDKFYITLGDDREHFYICQYFVFDRIIQPIDYYSPENEDMRAIR